MKKKIILSMLCLFLLCGCGKIPKLKNGEEAVITFAKDGKKHKISADDLYQELKNNFGLEATVKLINSYILENEFASYKEKAESDAKNYMDGLIEAYGDETKLLEAVQSNTNYSTLEAYQDYLYLSFMETHATKEYAKTLVTDKEIDAYYKDEVKGDVEIYHILVTPKVTDGMKDEEKTKAEDTAKETINKIIKELDESKDKLDTFKKLVKKYTEDESTKSKDGNLGYINYGDLSDKYDELIDAAYKLKDGEYSKSIITTEMGYHVIYRKSIKEKDKLKDIKDEIIESLAERKMQQGNLAVDSLKYYRKLYNMEIIDSTLNRQYGIYLNNLANKGN